MDPRKLHPSPIQHPELPRDLVRRIRLVRACLLGAYTHSMDYWMDGFKRDSHPSREIAYWEHLAAVCREYCAMTPQLTRLQHEQVFRLILQLNIVDDVQQLKKQAAGLPDEALENIMRLYADPKPIFDIVEEIPFADDAEPSAQKSEPFPDLDKERFPDDLPEELIRKLMGTQKA